MNVSVIYFAVAVAVAFALYYIFPLRYRWIVLIVVSLGFYAFMSTYALVFVVLTAIGVYFGARAVHKRNARLAVALENATQPQRADDCDVPKIRGGGAFFGSRFA